jgi:hypothetical protein
LSASRREAVVLVVCHRVLGLVAAINKVNRPKKFSTTAPSYISLLKGRQP